MLICLNMSAPNVLIDTFYARLHNLDQEESFSRVYGMSSDRFISEFRQFLNLPIAEQLLILPTNYPPIIGTLKLMIMH